MAVDTPVAANVNVGVTGAVYVGALGTAAPTSATMSLNAAFKGLGYLSDDGVGESRDITTESIRAWQLNRIVREVVTEAGIAFTFTCIETKKETVETFYGSAVTDATGLITIDPANTGGAKAWVLDVIDGADIIRTYIAEGEITDPGDVTYSNGGDPIGYEMTITAYVPVLRWYTSLIVAP